MTWGLSLSYTGPPQLWFAARVLLSCCAQLFPADCLSFSVLFVAVSLRDLCLITQKPEAVLTKHSKPQPVWPWANRPARSTYFFVAFTRSSKYLSAQKPALPVALVLAVVLLGGGVLTERQPGGSGPWLLLRGDFLHKFWEPQTFWHCFTNVTFSLFFSFLRHCNIWSHREINYTHIYINLAS